MLWPNYGTHLLFWPIRAHSTRPHYGDYHTHHGKETKLQRDLQWVEVLLRPATHRATHGRCRLFHFGEFSHSGWILSWMKISPSSYIHVSLNWLFNLNEIYIRNSPHRHQSHCSWLKLRARKHELLLKIHTLYIEFPPLLRWLGRLLTFLKSKTAISRL